LEILKILIDEIEAFLSRTKNYFLGTLNENTSGRKVTLFRTLTVAPSVADKKILEKIC
jgi:hypothetical protein